MKLVQSVYLPTVCYRLEFIASELKMVKELQISVNNTIRSILIATMKYANKILYTETGIELTETRSCAEERKEYARHLNYEYGIEHPWYRCIAKKWKADRIRRQNTELTKIGRMVPIFEIERDKNKAIQKDQKGWERKQGEEVWVYTDRSKKEDEAAIV